MRRLLSLATIAVALSTTAVAMFGSAGPAFAKSGPTPTAGSSVVCTSLKYVETTGAANLSKCYTASGATAKAFKTLGAASSSTLLYGGTLNWTRARAARTVTTGNLAATAADRDLPQEGQDLAFTGLVTGVSGTGQSGCQRRCRLRQRLRRPLRSSWPRARTPSSDPSRREGAGQCDPRPCEWRPVVCGSSSGKAGHSGARAPAKDVGAVTFFVTCGSWLFEGSTNEARKISSHNQFFAVVARVLGVGQWGAGLRLSSPSALRHLPPPSHSQAILRLLDRGEWWDQNMPLF